MFTVGATSAGAASQIDVDPTLLADPSLLAASSSAAGLPGNNQNMLAMIATERTALAGGSDPATTFTNIVSSFGASSQRAKAMSDQDGALLDNLTQLRESVSGVSLDEEMVNLTGGAARVRGGEQGHHHRRQHARHPDEPEVSKEIACASPTE